MGGQPARHEGLVPELYLAEWERDLLTITHEQSQYFIPQIETRIMNEGWASYWHKHIVDSLDLPPDLSLEFLVRHNQVVRPHKGGINPYPACGSGKTFTAAPTRSIAATRRR